VFLTRLNKNVINIQIIFALKIKWGRVRLRRVTIAALKH